MKDEVVHGSLELLRFQVAPFLATLGQLTPTRFFDGFTDRGMGMDGQANVRGGRTHFNGVRRLGDQLAGVHADDAGADQPAGVRIEDQLGHTGLASQ